MSDILTKGGAEVRAEEDGVPRGPQSQTSPANTSPLLLCAKCGWLISDGDPNLEVAYSLCCACEEEQRPKRCSFPFCDQSATDQGLCGAHRLLFAQAQYRSDMAQVKVPILSPRDKALLIALVASTVSFLAAAVLWLAQGWRAA